ncbi:MAG: hypothetical protein ACRDWW_03845 [Acidimicrobiales bacterium]
MAQLRTEEGDLVVHLTYGEKVAGLHGDIRVPLSAIVSVTVPPVAWLALRGWRMAGTGIPGFVAVGTRRHASGYDFTAMHGQRPVVQVDLHSGRFERLLISVDEGLDAQAEADRIADAAGIRRSPPG